MKILITTGLLETDIGGPSQYASKLRDEFQVLGHDVKIVSYGSVERSLFIGLRHIYFFLRIIPKCLWADCILTLDTFSVGLPSVLAASLFHKKVIVRAGGDFVWSAYVNRTDVPVKLSSFYKSLPNLDRKERLIFFLTKFLTKRASFFAFNTKWQERIWSDYYKIENSRSGVVRNFIPEKKHDKRYSTKNFLWAGRLIPEKNIELLEKAVSHVKTRYPEFRLDIVTDRSHQNVLDMIKESYAVISPAVSDICPNFILEGISFNKPFVMTQDTGLREICPKGGIFVDSLNEGELEKAVEAVLDDNIYNKLRGELEEVNLEHSWGDIADKYLNIWQSL